MARKVTSRRRSCRCWPSSPTRIRPERAFDVTEMGLVQHGALGGGRRPVRALAPAVPVAADRGARLGGRLTAESADAALRGWAVSRRRQSSGMVASRTSSTVITPSIWRPRPPPGPSSGCSRSSARRRRPRPCPRRPAPGRCRDVDQQGAAVRPARRPTTVTAPHSRPPASTACTVISASGWILSASRPRPAPLDRGLPPAGQEIHAHDPAGAGRVEPEQRSTLVRGRPGGDPAPPGAAAGAVRRSRPRRRRPASGR